MIIQHFFDIALTNVAPSNYFVQQKSCKWCR